MQLYGIHFLKKILMRKILLLVQIFVLKATLKWRGFFPSTTNKTITFFIVLPVITWDFRGYQLTTSMTSFLTLPWQRYILPLFHQNHNKLPTTAYTMLTHYPGHWAVEKKYLKFLIGNEIFKLKKQHTTTNKYTVDTVVCVFNPPNWP